MLCGFERLGEDDVPEDTSVLWLQAVIAECRAFVAAVADGKA